jgi:predicted nucleotidyltransferase
LFIAGETSMKSPIIYITEIQEWAKHNPDIIALALVGSHARHEARTGSDIDLVIISGNKASLLEDFSWVETFGKVEKLSLEKWGVVTSIRVFYEDGQEIEFGITSVKWASPPIDPGTLRVTAGGINILKDTNKLLENLKSSSK